MKPTIRELASKHWTSERLQKLTQGKKLLLLPTNGSELLFQIGLLNKDATMSADNTSKFLQINHMLELMRRPLEELKSRFTTVKILDCGCGNSYLTFLVAWLFRDYWEHPLEIWGIDSNPKAIESSKKKAQGLGWEDFVKFECTSVDGFFQNFLSNHADDLKAARFHGVVSLHACDTATDDAIGFGLRSGADFIASAPCCQAELSKKWTALAAQNLPHDFRVVFNSPNLRRDSAAVMTDALRVLLIRGSGYEVVTTEFVPSQHTPKNRLILAERLGQFLKESLGVSKNLSQALGQVDIKLASLIPEKPMSILEDLKLSEKS